MHSHFSYECGGGSGIRTHDTVTRIAVFKTAAFVRSAIPPLLLATVYRRPGKYRPVWPVLQLQVGRHGRMQHAGA